MTRQDKIKGLIRILYQRFNKDVSEAQIEAMAIIHNKDLAMIPEEALQQVYHEAYFRSDSEKIPKTKDLLIMYRLMLTEGSLSRQGTRCPDCGGLGFISGIWKPDRTGQVAFLCGCRAANNPHGFAVWDYKWQDIGYSKTKERPFIPF